MTYSLEIDPGLEPRPCTPALIWAEGIAPPFEQEPMPEFLRDAIARAAELDEEAWAPGVKAAVRDMLRHGKYKPAGRGKPASEFLLKAAGKGDFPLVCAPVDVNNAISLESGLPGSLFDLALCGPRLLLRRGQPGEAYVFNRTGQEIDLTDLLLVCRQVDGAWEPCGNPVKDAMVTKIQPDTRDVLAVLYAPAGWAAQEVERWAGRYAQLLEQHCAAKRGGFEVIGA